MGKRRVGKEKERLGKKQRKEKVRGRKEGRIKGERGAGATWGMVAFWR